MDIPKQVVGGSDSGIWCLRCQKRQKQKKWCGKISWLGSREEIPNRVSVCQYWILKREEVEGGDEPDGDTDCDCSICL